MSNPTSNFGWVMPNPTDLVTDLPADFEVFGQAVDTSLADLKGGTTGQILAKATNTDMDFTWVANDVGDITAVTAGTGITGGGTSGAVTVSFDQANFGGGQWAAGKNKIINGDFGINQRSFTSNTTSNAYNFDRFSQVNGGTGATLTVTPQTFTAGTAPVAGYEGTNFVRCVTTNGSDTSTFSIFSQRVEDVRTLAGQTATFSFWAKAASGTPKVSFEIEQSFGSGGSSAVTLAAASATTISTSWARYTVTINVPSVSGKTIGAGSYLGVYLWVSAGSAFNSRANSIGLQTGTFDFWGWQLEAAQTASNFQTATGTKQGELAACQRYLPAVLVGSGNRIFGYAASTTSTYFGMTFPVTARVAPTGITAAAVANFTLVPSTGGFGSPTAIAFDSSGVNSASINVTSTAGTPTLALNTAAQLASTAAAAYILFTGCEL